MVVAGVAIEDAIVAIDVLKNPAEDPMVEVEMDVPVEVADVGITSMVVVENVFHVIYYEVHF